MVSQDLQRISTSLRKLRATAALQNAVTLLKLWINKQVWYHFLVTNSTAMHTYCYTLIRINIILFSSSPFQILQLSFLPIRLTGCCTHPACQLNVCLANSDLLVLCLLHNSLYCMSECLSPLTCAICSKIKPLFYYT